MFQCEYCLVTTLPGVEASRIVMRRRRVTYPVRSEVHPKRRKKKGRKRRDDPGGVGWEIEKELTLCPAYATLERF